MEETGNERGLSSDGNAVFDPSSDITNFIDFSDDSSCWLGTIESLKTETYVVSYKDGLKRKADVLSEEEGTLVKLSLNKRPSFKLGICNAKGVKEQTVLLPTDYQVVPVELKPAQVQKTRGRGRQSSRMSVKPVDFDENAPAEIIMNFGEKDTIPSEKSLSKMFRRFGPIRELLTEVDKENYRARVVFKECVDAEVVYESVGKFDIFGKMVVSYELNYTITEGFKSSGL